MLQVIRHFGASSSRTAPKATDNIGMFTVQYPEERLSLAETFRNMPILLYDDETGQELCTSCFQCERICPPQVIHIVQAIDPNTGKPVPAVEEFVIEYDACMSCGYCAEVCPFDAIKMDHDYELSTPDHLSMDVAKRELNRPISYYSTIAPNLWADVQAQAIKKLGNNVKRRSGNIGIAPHLWGRQLAAAPAAGATARPPEARPRRSRLRPGKPRSARACRPIRWLALKRFAPPSAAVATLRAPLRGRRSDEALQGQPVAEAATHMEGSNAGAPAAAAPSGPQAAIGQNMSDDKRARLEVDPGRQARRAGRRLMSWFWNGLVTGDPNTANWLSTRCHI